MALLCVHFLEAEPGWCAGVPSIPEQALRAAAESLSKVAQDAKGAHASTAALALGYAGLQGTLPLPAGLEAPGESHPNAYTSECKQCII